MALFASAGALWMRHALTPLFGTQYPFLLSSAAIFFSVWCCGVGPAILAAAMSFLGVWYWFLPAVHSFALENPRAEVAGLLSFLITCIFVIALGAAQQRSRTRLEEEVRERLRVEAALRDTERELQEAQRLARIGSWKWDAASDSVTWTRELYRIAGRDPSLPAPSYAEMPSRYTPESWQRMKAAVERALNSGESYELELEMVRPDGSQIMVITHAEALRDAAGKVVGLMGSLQDITERKRTEEALRLATERFQVALKGARIAVFNHDLDLRCTWVYNPDLGYDPSLVIGRTDLELAERAEDAEVTMAIKREVIRSGVGRHQEIRFRQRGEDRWYQLVVEPLRDSEGGISGVTCATVDITERRQAEDALRLSEERLRIAQKAAHSGTFEFQIQARRLISSPEFAELYGFAPGTASEDVEDWRRLIPPEDLAARDHALALTLANHQTEYQAEFRILRPDGSFRWVQSSARVFYDQEGNPQRIIGVNTDITERKQIEENLRENEDRLRIAQRAGHSGTYERSFKTGTMYASPELREIYGLGPAETVIGREPWRQAVYPEDLARVDRELAALIADRATEARSEFRIHRSDGALRWIESTAKIFYDDSGSPLRLVAICTDITERKQAEEALRASEGRLRFVAEGAEVGIWDWDLVTERLEGSALCRKIFGVAEAEEFSFAKFLAVLHPEDRETTHQAIRMCLEGGGRIGYDQEYRAIRPNGSIRWIQARGSASFEDGRPVRMAGIVLDVTERKQAEDSLRASEERLRFIAERASAGFWDWDLVSGRLDWSPLCKQLFGIPLDEKMSYERFLESVHPEDRELTDRINRAYLESDGGPEYEHEYRVIWPDGTVRWIHAKGSATFKQGRALRMAGIVLDITERRHHEEALRKNEQRLRMAHQAAHSGAWEVDLASREIMWSPEMQGLWGLVPGSISVAETRAQISRMLHPEDQPIVDQALVDALAGKGYHLVFRVHRADGALRWMESFGEVVYDENKTPQRIVGVAIDITERRQAEEELRKSHLELERKVEERTQALAASLASLELEVEIRKQTEVALQGLSARLLRLQDEERRRVARDLHDSTGQTLAALKMTIASLEGMVAGQIPEARQIIRDLNALTEDALKDIRTTSHLLHPPLLDEVGFTSAARWYVDELAKRSGIQMRLELSVAAGRLTKSSELAFFRVLQEGLTNVIRHSGSSAAEVSLHGNHENATLTIKDYGKGIPQHTLNTFRETGAGVGVGLGGMKQRIRELGGQLEIASDGTGTSITAILPTADIEPAAPRGDGTSGEAVGQFKPTRLL
jgi:PAS domain S-box-containing protein